MSKVLSQTETNICSGHAVLGQIDEIDMTFVSLNSNVKDGDGSGAGGGMGHFDYSLSGRRFVFSSHLLLSNH